MIVYISTQLPKASLEATERGFSNLFASYGDDGGKMCKRWARDERE